MCDNLLTLTLGVTMLGFVTLVAIFIWWAGRL